MTEKISFEAVPTSVRTTTDGGFRITFDVPGSPEMIVPISHLHAIMITKGCVKLTVETA